MDFDVLTYLSWREALIVIVVLLTLYVGFVFLRIQRLKREKKSHSARDYLAAQSAIAAYTTALAPESPAASDALSSPPPPSAPDPGFPWNEPPAEKEWLLKTEMLEREIEQLRKEVGGLRAEVLVLREEQRREVSQSRASENISPVYSDAMQMAMQGNDAATISQYCGISRAEAELVVALVRNQN